MKNLLLTAVASAACLTGMAQSLPKSMVSADGNQVNIKTRVDKNFVEILQGKTPSGARILTPQKAVAHKANPVKKSFAKAPAEAETLTFTAFAKSLYENGYTYSYDNGDLFSYEVQVVFDGDKATFTNLFNIDEQYAGYGHTQCEMTGDYDAATGTITFETPMDFTNGAIFGTLYNDYYTGIMRGGEATPSGGFDASIGMVTFNVSADRSSITSNENILLMMGLSGGNAYAFSGFKFINMYQPQEGSKLISMNDDAIAFRTDIYPELSESKTLLFANIGNETADFTTSCQGDAFSTNPISGSVAPMSILPVSVNFTPMAEGSYEGSATITSGEDSYTFSTTGACIAYPDYSVIVKSGEFSFSTGMEYPFRIGDQNGNPIVGSSNIQIFGDSWLKAKFTVPEGKIATISWKGNTYTDQWFASQATITNDAGDNIFTSLQGYEELGGSSRFAPGEHYLLFNYNVSYAGYCTEDDWMMICDLETSYEDLQDYNVAVESGNQMSFGNFLSGTNSFAKDVVLQNLGAQPLKVTSVKSSSNFYVYDCDDEAATMERLNVMVEFEGSEAGQYDETIEINTTAGNFSILCSALVRQTPDYSKIVSPDTDPTVEFIWDNNPTDPFILDETTNQLVNANARELDSIASTSWVVVEFEVPEGKMGHLTWDASLDVAGINEETGFNSDIAWVDIATSHGNYTYGGIADDRMDSEWAYTAHFPDANSYTPGTNYVQWRYAKAGDNSFGGKDEFRIWNVKLLLEDFASFGYSLDKEVLDFGQLFQGRSSSKRITLTNEGADQIFIESVDYDGPISCDYIPSYSISYKGQFWLDFNFTAETVGDFSGSITLHTANGDIFIPCVANVLDTSAYALVGDFEDSAAGWSAYDADDDGKNWDLLWSLFGGYPDGHAHTGADGMGSTAYYYYMPDLDPDNWLFSPYFEVPANGNWELSWWIGVEEDEYDYCHHTYTVYVGEDMAGREQTMDEVFTETLDQTGWQERKVDLSAYAGKTVSVAFRHHDSVGQRLLKLDDVFVQLNQTVGVNAIAGVNASEQQVYSLTGARQQQLTDGINIIRTINADGSIKVQKVVK